MSQLELLTEFGGVEQAGWSRLARVAGDVQKREIRPYVLLALKELSGQLEERARSVVSAERFSCVRAVVRHLARSRSARGAHAYRLDDVTNFLEGLRFNADCVTELATLLCAEEVYSHLPTHRASDRRLTSAQCRVDISLCQVNMADAQADEEERRGIVRRDARVVLTLQLSDGTSRSYRMSVTKLHELRFAVATLLKNLIVLERRKCMKGD